VPNVKGLQQGAAVTLLVNHHLVAGTPQVIDSPKAPQNFVIGSLPKQGQPAKPGSTVILKVASGFVKVPSVSGMSCTEAKKALTKLTLQPSCQNRPSQAPKDQAFATSLGSVTRIAQHTPVTVFISSGPSLVSLPFVVGDPAGQAKAALHSAGFGVLVTQQPECTDPSKNFIVQSQNPSGTTAPRGSTISIVVARYKPNDPSCVGPPGST
jgi:beta-lactam-binding protein with PASTA domain